MNYSVSSVALSVCIFMAGAYVSTFAQPDNHNPSPMPCVLLGDSPNVYVGQVLGMRVDESKKENDEFVLIEFLIRESFVGTPKDGRVVLGASSYFADGIGIAVGRSYLIYAYNKQTDDAFASFSAYTKSVDKAGAELAFLRGLRENPQGAWIFGRVDLVVRSSHYKNWRQPVPYARLVVRADSDKKRFEITSDENGNYVLENMPSGWYLVTPDLPTDANLVSDGGQGTLVNNACSGADILIRSKNSVNGVVTDSGGKPVSKVPVELVPVDYVKPNFNIWPNYYERGVTENDGAFTISNISPGKYHLAVNYTIQPEFESPYIATFYPGTLIRSKAQTIEVFAGKEINGLKFVLGPERLIEKKVTGRVLYADGRPAANTYVYLKEDENESCCVLKKATTDAQGNFSIVGFESRKYRLWSQVDHKPFTNKINYFGASPVFVLDSRTGSFQIVLRPTTKNSLDAVDEIEMQERKILR